MELLRRERLLALLLHISTIVFCWLAMQAVHESGHVLHALWSGARVTKVVLHPATLSRTDVAFNNTPRFVAWGGFIWGIVVPLGVLALVRAYARHYFFLAQFFAGFCLVANGAYMAAGAVWRIGDSADLLSHGESKALLIALGVLLTAAGLWAWNGLGRHFAIGRHAEHVTPRLAWTIAGAAAVLLVVELMVDSR